MCSILSMPFAACCAALSAVLKTEFWFCSPLISLIAAQDPCTPSPCSPFAACKALGSRAYQCTCKEGFQGDGKICQPINPCVDSNGGCPENSTICLYRRPGEVRAITAKVWKMARGEVLQMNWWTCGSNLLSSTQILQRETRQLFCRITNRVKDGECSSMITVLPSLRQLVFASLGWVGELLHPSVWHFPAIAGSIFATWLPRVKLTLRGLLGKPVWKLQIKKLTLQLEWKLGLDELNFEETDSDMRSMGQRRPLRRTC